MSTASVVNSRKGINHFVMATTFAGNQVYTQLMHVAAGRPAGSGYPAKAFDR
jgi:hypothetical protein